MKQDIVWKDRKRPFCGLPLSFTVYSCDSERLFVKTGIFNIEENEVRLYRVLDLKLTRSFIQRIFGVGTIVISSSDRLMGNFEIKDIKHSWDIKEMLSELVEKQRDAKHVSSREYMNGACNDSVDDDITE